MYLVVIISFLIITAAFQPNIVADSNNLSPISKSIEVTVEICNTFGGKDKTIKLSKQNADLLSNILDDIKNDLVKANTQEEIIAIFNESIKSIKDYGLLGGNLDIEAQQILKRSNFNRKFANLSEIIHSMSLWLSDENFLCSIAGNTTNTHFLRFSNLFSNYFISFGNFERCGYGFIKIPSDGWVWSQGIMGVVNWTGEFYGNLHPYLFLGLNAWSFLGISGFKGIRISYENGYTYFFGSALRIRLR